MINVRQDECSPAEEAIIQRSLVIYFKKCNGNELIDLELKHLHVWKSFENKSETIVVREYLVMERKVIESSELENPKSLTHDLFKNHNIKWLKVQRILVLPGNVPGTLPGELSEQFVL